MTQLTKREQIALEMFLERYRARIDENFDESIEFSVSTTDRFLKHLAETEPNLQPETRSVFHEMLDMIEGSRPAVVFTHENPEATGQVVNDNKHPMKTDDIVHWLVQNVGLSYEYRQMLKHHINALVSYEVNKAK